MRYLVSPSSSDIPLAYNLFQSLRPVYSPTPAPEKMPSQAKAHLVNTSCATCCTASESLARGKGSSGAGRPRNLLRGAQPSFSSISRRYSWGTWSRTSWLWMPIRPVHQGFNVSDYHSKMACIYGPEAWTGGRIMLWGNTGVYTYEAPPFPDPSRPPATPAGHWSSWQTRQSWPGSSASPARAP